MSRALKIRSVLLSEDLRVEVTGREILIGMFTGVVPVSAFPTLFPVFVVRVEAMVFLPDPKESRMQMRNPKGIAIADIVSKVQHFPRHDLPLPIQFRFSPFVFEMEGEHSIYFGIDGRIEKVSTFRVEQVKLPSNPEGVPTHEKQANQSIQPEQIPPRKKARITS